MQRTRRIDGVLSSFMSEANTFLLKAGFERGPWLVVAFAAGIAAWFMLQTPWQWIAAIGASLLVSLSAIAIGRIEGRFSALRDGVAAIAIALALGVVVVWLRSASAGADPLRFPRVEHVDARILDRTEQPAQDRIRLTLAMRDAQAGIARKVRINVPQAGDNPAFREGAIIRLRVRLMPPAPPPLPGSYDFARTAWFQGLSATGSALGPIELVKASDEADRLAEIQRQLSRHVRSRLTGSPASIAAAFASGDRGAISTADEKAMRDSGLTHLLSISGLHVSAVIAAAYFLALKLLALWSRLALRVRLPVVAASIAALAGIAYTMLTGSEVPTVRSCVGAVLVLLALAIGREPLGLRMVAVAAAFVLFVWPESLIGPSFQLSFAAVLSIVALHNAAPVRSFLAPREEGRTTRMARHASMLLITGLVIEIALLPIVMFHFHRGGVYGALANVVAIPLVTFVTMPLIALALLGDLAGIGGPVWWGVQTSLELLVAIAHFTAAQPGAVKLMPQMDGATFFLFLAGGLWLALWRGRTRLWGLVPAGLATLLLIATPVADVLITGDGRHVGIAGEADRLLILREGRSDYAQDNLLEIAGMEGEPIALANWPEAACSRDFCTLTLTRGGRNWVLLMARSRYKVEERALAAACTRSDIVVADRWLPRGCRPRWLKADRRMLSQTGGLAIYLSQERIDTVARHQGRHGWWRSEID